MPTAATCAFSSVTKTLAIEPSFAGTSPWSMSQAFSSPICRPTSTRISRSAIARRTHGIAPERRAVALRAAHERLQLLEQARAACRRSRSGCARSRAPSSRSRSPCRARRSGGRAARARCRRTARWCGCSTSSRWPAPRCPGASIGTIIIEMPWCLGASGSVRTATQLWVAVCALVFQIFWPLITHSSPSSTARVRSAARSVPASGSE